MIRYVDAMSNGLWWEYVTLGALATGIIVALILAMWLVFDSRSPSTTALSVLVIPPVLVGLAMWFSGKVTYKSVRESFKDGFGDPTASWSRSGLLGWIENAVHPFTLLDMAIIVPAGVVILGLVVGSVLRGRRVILVPVVGFIVMLVVGIVALSSLTTMESVGIATLTRMAVHGALGVLFVGFLLRQAGDRILPKLAATIALVSTATILSVEVSAFTATLPSSHMLAAFDPMGWGSAGYAWAIERPLPGIALPIAGLITLFLALSWLSRAQHRRQQRILQAADALLAAGPVAGNPVDGPDALLDAIEQARDGDPQVDLPSYVDPKTSKPTRAPDLFFEDTVDGVLTVEEQFSTAKRNIEPHMEHLRRPDRMALLALKDQAEQGDATGDRPSERGARERYDAWVKKSGLSRQAAMEQYIALADRLR